MDELFIRACKSFPVRLHAFFVPVAFTDDKINIAVVMHEIMPEGAYTRPRRWMPDKELLQRLLTRAKTS